MNIILCGMPGSGKTYLGKLAAKQCGCSFLDTDEAIVAMHRLNYPEERSCTEIVKAHGQEYFRQLEHSVILDLNGTSRAVVALGGGSLGRKDNISLLCSLGTLIYLKAPMELLFQRAMDKPYLPTYLDQDNPEGSFKQLWQTRIPLYEQHCQYMIEVTAEDILHKICSLIHKAGDYGK